MEKTWMVLKTSETVKKSTIIIDGVKHKEEKYEFCFLCSNTKCDLIGYYGTYNAFGSFKGICLECFKRLEELLNLDYLKILEESLNKENKEEDGEEHYNEIAIAARKAFDEYEKSKQPKN